MSFDKGLWKAALIGISSKKNVRPSWSHKLKSDSSEKTTWCQSGCQVQCSWVHGRRSCQWFAERGTGIKALLHAVHCAADPRAANSCRIIHHHGKQMSIDARWRHFPSSIVSFSSCSVLVGPLLPNSHHCGTVPLHTSCYWMIGWLLVGCRVLRPIVSQGT